ncbi:MAG: hypothetical protein ABIW34_00715, partial [Ginsengibacter sp.]
MGTVNGTWTLILKDEDIFNDGNLQQFCLLFCDDNGINCNTCNANGGFFTEDKLEFCKNDPGLNLNLKVNLPNFIPDINVYGYKYYIIENDVIVGFSASLDMRNFNSGDYTLCGISYLLQDSSKLPNVNSGIKFSSFKNDVVSGKAGICAELSKNCVNIIIKQVVPPTNLTIKVCSKDTFKISGTSYTKTGMFQQILTSANGCDSIINLDLTVTELKAMIKIPDDLNCSRSNVILDASSSSVPTNAKLVWSTDNGNIVDVSNLYKIVINKRGTYKLVISNGNCIDSVEVTVINTTNVPELDVTYGVITCKNPFIVARSTSNITNVTWTWKDISNATLGDQDTLIISKPGKYVSIVTDASGCTNKFNFEVKLDKSLPQVSLNSTPISCRTDSAYIGFSLINSIESFQWDGPNNFISNDTIALVRNAGLYHLLIVGLNGCSLDTFITVQSLVKRPDFSYAVDKITCIDTCVLIKPTIFAPLKKLEFKGTGSNLSFYSSDFNPKICISGRYDVRVVDTAECVLDTFVIVEEDSQKADIKLSAIDLKCGQDSIQITIFHNTNPGLNYSYDWIGPIGFSSMLKDPWARERGVYKVTVTLLNGCKTTDSIIVKEDTARPKIELFTDSLTCIKKNATISSQAKNAQSYSWSGPSNFTDDKPIISITQAGFYKVIVTANNGCTAERTTEVVNDSIPPFSGITQDTLNCIKTNIVLKPKYASNSDSIYWSFNNSFFSLDSFPVANIPGLYY